MPEVTVWETWGRKNKQTFTLGKNSHNPLSVKEKTNLQSGKDKTILTIFDRQGKNLLCGEGETKLTVWENNTEHTVSEKDQKIYCKTSKNTKAEGHDNLISGKAQTEHLRKTALESHDLLSVKNKNT